MNDVKLQISQTTKPIRKSNYPKLYQKIFDSTSWLPTSAKIKERVYCIQHNINSSILCRHCETGLVKFLGPSTGYREFCSTNCSSNSESKQKDIKQTNLRKFGTNTPAQNKEIRQKTINTLEERYGIGTTSTQQVVSIRQKTIDANNIKFGTDFYTSSQNFKQKSKNSTIVKYGTAHISQRNIPTRSLELLNNPNWLMDQNHSQQKTLLTISEELQVSISTVSVYFNKYNIIPTYYTAVSKQEQDLVTFLTQYVSINHQDRTLIKPKELDIVIPDKKLAIEYCGLYWHSDIHPRITKNYHLDKLQQCAQLGYRLITIFEDEWMYKRDIVKSRLIHLLGISQTSIYGRNTTIVEVSANQKQEFFDSTHIQGNGRGSITYGLESNTKIVAMITFMNLGNGNYELNRYSTIGNVVGGFSKLLTHFQKNHNWISISSFADRRWSEGDIYHSNGFKLINTSLPSYDYIVKNTRIHRRNFMKGLLSKKLLNFCPTLTEFENCDNNNLLRIWNCGQLKFIKYNKQL